jgi:hypothetical protein
MVFNQTGKISKEKFLLGDQELENTQNYKYLGIVFTASGTFGMAKNELYKKGLKAYFKLCKSMGNLTPAIKTSIHVFNHTIKPVLLYGCEIWGQFSTKCKVLKNNGNNYNLNQLYPKELAEKLQLKYYKHLLGVNKYCADAAVYGELGEIPIYSDIVTHMAKYWHRMHSVSDNTLLYDAYMCDVDLGNNGNDSLSLAMKCILKQLDLYYLFANPALLSTKVFGAMVKKKIHEKHKETWESNLLNDSNRKEGGNKLRTYRKFKNKLYLEPYLLTVKNRDDRRRLCQLHTSAHKLNIETGRYQQIPECNRICPMCPNGQIENEIHFMTQCPAYLEQRIALYAKLDNRNFQKLNDENKFIWMMSNEDPDICQYLARYVNKTLSLRYEQI